MNYQQQMKLKRINSLPWVVWALLAIQIVVYLGMTIVGLRLGAGLDGSKSTLILQYFGAMQKDLVIQYHQYWRFFTPMFVHIGLMHLIVNSMTLYFLGVQLEGLLGHWRFLLIYLLSGIAGNVLSFSFGNPIVTSAGASTALFGLFGFFVALGRVYHNHPNIQFMAQRMLTLIVMNLIFNVFSSGIDILGHIGGVIGGFLLGFIVSVPSLKNSHYQSDTHDVHRQIRAAILFLFFLIVCLVYGFRTQLGL